MSKLLQQELFDEAITCWPNLSLGCRKEIQELLTQLFIKALTTKSVIQSKENSHASKNSNKTYREDSLSLS